MLSSRYDIDGYKLNLFEIGIVEDLRKSYPKAKSVSDLTGDLEETWKVERWLDRLVRKNIIERYNQTYRYAVKERSDLFV